MLHFYLLLSLLYGPINNLPHKPALGLKLLSSRGSSGRAISAGGDAGQWSVMFQGFEPSGGLDGALALIEHLREGLGFWQQQRQQWRWQLTL